MRRPGLGGADCLVRHGCLWVDDVNNRVADGLVGFIDCRVRQRQQADAGREACIFAVNLLIIQS